MTIYNTLTRKQEPFVPNRSNLVTMYVCGITPYDTTHLGHAFGYLFFDVLQRYLLYKGYTVVYTQNVTDVNDRDKDILERAREQNIGWKQLSNYWTARFLSEMEMLGWLRPQNYIKASDTIDFMIELIQKIVSKGFGYEKKGSVYLDIAKVRDYGKLSKLSENKMLKLALEFEEDTENPDKKHRLDIVLWRAKRANQPDYIPSFGSPFGKGRPGWHIECSAMAIKTLGEQIDIHGGGKDLIYPHHENEIVQSEAATGKVPYVRFWVHTGVVLYRGKKMSKSWGNLVMISSLLENYSPNAIRLMLLSHHYRSDWEFFEKDLESAQVRTQEIAQILAATCPDKEYPCHARQGVSLIEEEKFKSFLDDDMNTPGAFGFINQTADRLKAESNHGRKLRLHASLVAMLKILGFSPRRYI